MWGRGQAGFGLRSDIRYHAALRVPAELPERDSFHQGQDAQGEAEGHPASSGRPRNGVSGGRWKACRLPSCLLWLLGQSEGVWPDHSLTQSCCQLEKVSAVCTRAGHGRLASSPCFRDSVRQWRRDCDRARWKLGTPSDASAHRKSARISSGQSAWLMFMPRNFTLRAGIYPAAHQNATPIFARIISLIRQSWLLISACIRDL